jgi:glutathione S-transferase
MIKLHQFPPVWGLPNASPFCLKVETYLKMAALPYEIAPVFNPAKAPKGKLPYIVDNGKTVADSGLILDYLKASYGDKLDGHLGPAERAAALALQRLMEEHLYWCAIYDRWIVDENWAITKRDFFAGLPRIVFNLVTRVARRGQRRQLYGHGMGRHTREEIYALGVADIAALADWLGDKPFFMGAQPSSLDATAYAFLANLLWVPLDTPLTRAARERQNLAGYGERMKARYFK